MRVYHLKLPWCLRWRGSWRLPPAISRLKARCLNFDRSMKIVVFLIASIVIFFFIIPHIVELIRVHNQHFFKTKNLDACISEQLKHYDSAIAQFDAVAVHDALPSHHNDAAAQHEQGGARAADIGSLNADDSVSSHYLAFVGNGQIGVHLRFAGGARVGDLLVRADRTITLNASYNPLLHIELPNYAQESSLLVSFRDGLLHELSCFRKNDLCVAVERVAYVHRLYESLLVQEVRVANPTQRPVIARLVAVSAQQRCEPLTAKVLSLLAAAPSTARGVYCRDTKLRLDASGGVLPVRLFIQALVRAPNDASVLTAGSKLQLIAVATVDYGAPDGASAPPLELLVGAQSTRTHVECTFVRTRTLALQDADASKVSAELNFLEADLHEDLLGLAPQFCRFQLAAASRPRLRHAPVQLTDTEDDLMAAYAPMRALHTLAWNALYANGSSFVISYSHAPRALNPARINATLFYLLGHVPLFDTNTRITLNGSASSSFLLAASHGSMAQLARLIVPRALGAPATLDACYEGRVSTFAAAASGPLWQPVFDVRSLAATADAWLVTLTKKRCAPLVRAGAFGLLQAAVLSFGPLRFAHSHSGADSEPGGSDAIHRHLELVADPNDLHRDRMHFSRLFFNQDVALSIRVEIEPDSNKPFLFVDAERTVALDDPDADYVVDDDDDGHQHAVARRAARWPPLMLLAANAELHPLVEIYIAAGQRRSQTAARFALKYTDPPTALLYVAESRSHLEELRVATAVRSVIEFDAHPADVISLHREGHAFGALPLAFWALIGLLIVVFHLFLFKLIYDEFCSRKRRKPVAPPHRRRNLSSNSSAVDDDAPPNPNVLALKRLLAERASRSRRDSSDV